MARAMIPVALLGALILASSALPANADTVIPITNGVDGTTAGTLTVTRTNNVSPGWDEIDLNFATWTVTFPDTGLPTAIAIIGGTWTGVGGSLGVSSLDGSDWVPRTTNNNPTLLESFVNFDSVAPNWFTRGPGSAGSYAWFSSGTPGTGMEGFWQTLQHRFLGPADGRAAFFPGGSVDPLLAKMYVTTGADVEFDGYFDFGDGYLHLPWEGRVYVSFSTAVPEPSGFALLCTALVAGAIRAGRRKGDEPNHSPSFASIIEKRIKGSGVFVLDKMGGRW
jgi:hypothetical protein